MGSKSVVLSEMYGLRGGDQTYGRYTGVHQMMTAGNTSANDPTVTDQSITNKSVMGSKLTPY